jgi:cell division septation protein DedD
MRNLVLALVLANLAFAAWHSWDAPLQPVLHAPDSALPKLTLVTEVPADLRTVGTISDSQLPQAERPASSDPTAVRPSGSGAAPVVTPPGEPAASANASVADPGERCTTIGPFRDLSQAAAAAATLRAAGFEPEQRVREGDVWIGYWVYIQAIPSLEEASRILAKVRASGIADSYVIPDSDSGHLVSLGVFSEINGVTRRRNEARALGLEPQVVDRTRRAAVYWVDVIPRADQTIDFESLQPPGRILRLEQKPCGAVAG